MQTNHAVEKSFNVTKNNMRCDLRTSDTFEEKNNCFEINYN